MNFKKRLKYFLPIIILLILTPFLSKLDLIIAHQFFQPAAGSGGLFQENFITHTLYKFGMMPAFLISGVAGLYFLLSHFYLSLKKWRAPSICIILNLLLGPGLIINILFKGFWGRPRPIQLALFGGGQDFRPFYLPNFSEQASYFKSFPSGHCTMGFFFFALCFIAMRLKNKPLFYIAVFITLVLGLLLTYTRIAQGGHFFSDTLWAAGLMWYITLGIDWFVYDYLIKKKEQYFTS